MPSSTPLLAKPWPGPCPSSDDDQASHMQLSHMSRKDTGKQAKVWHALCFSSWHITQPDFTVNLLFSKVITPGVGQCIGAMHSDSHLCRFFFLFCVHFLLESTENSSMTHFGVTHQLGTAALNYIPLGFCFFVGQWPLISIL